MSSARLHEDWKHECIFRVRDLLFIYVQRLAVAQKLPCLLFRFEILEKRLIELLMQFFFFFFYKLLRLFPLVRPESIEI